MKELVRIKSFPNGLILQLDQTAEFETLLSEIAAKFKDGKAFFGNAAVALSFRGRLLSEEEENLIQDCIEKNCNLKIVCIVCKEEEQERIFSKALQQIERKKLAETEIGKEIQVFRGSLRDGEELDTPSSIIILGDVEYGCSLTSEKSIIVLGGLYGKVHAGKGNLSENSVIVALEMAPSELSIGDFKYVPSKKSKWGKKTKEQAAMIAGIRENAIYMEKLTKEHLRDF